MHRFVLLTVLACAFAGLSIAYSPLVALIFASALLFAALLELGPVFLISAAVLVASMSRVLQLAGVPRLVNFLHFVLVAEAVVAALIRRDSVSPFTRQLARFLAAAFAVCFLSWVMNDGELVRPVMLWLVLCEPFLALFALVQGRPSPEAMGRLWKILIGITLIQIPFVVFQFAVVARGNPDKIQGTFIGQGAGAHVMGGVMLTAVLFCIAKALSTTGSARRTMLGAAAVLFVVPVIADAKQVIVCFLPGLLGVFALSRRGSFLKMIAPAAVAALLFGCAFVMYQPLQRLSNTSMLESGVEGKIAGLEVLARHMSHRPAGWLLGVGPGNSVSRIALMPVQEPVQFLKLRISPVTEDLLNVSKHNYLWNSSSVWSSISSWAGVVGDLGPLGLLVYLWGAGLVWRELMRSSGWLHAGAAGALIMAGTLGLFYSWLEEPGFMLVVFAATGLTIAGTGRTSETRSLRANAIS